MTPPVCLITPPHSRAAKAVPWTPSAKVWRGRPARLRVSSQPTTLPCPKCGATLLKNVTAWVCPKSLAQAGKPATCDFSAPTARVAERASASPDHPIDPELIVLLARHGIRPSGAYEQWRTTPRLAGEINGLPASRGVLVATNGILCLIEQADGLYEGHLQWFEPDGSQDLAPVGGAAAKPRKISKQRAALLAALEAYE